MVQYVDSYQLIVSTSYLNRKGFLLDIIFYLKLPLADQVLVPMWQKYENYILIREKPLQDCSS